MKLRVALSGLLAAMFVLNAFPVYARFAGEVPEILTLDRSGNVLHSIAVGNIWVTKGVGEAGDRGRFLLQTSAEFTDADTGGYIASFSQEDSVWIDENAEPGKQGSVLLMYVKLLVPEEAATAIKAVLDKYVVLCAVRVDLLLVDGRGVGHVLDTVELETLTIKPAGGPTPMP